MIRRLLALAGIAAALTAPHVLGDGHDGLKRPFAGSEGKWKVVFANGVTETCEIGKDGKASVVEPLRSSAGQAGVNGGSFVISFADDRVERWTPVGKRFVVEHWFPASQMTIATLVLGIAEQSQ